LIAQKDHDQGGGTGICVRKIRLLDAAFDQFRVYWKQPIRVAMEIDVSEPLEEVSFGVGLRQLDGSFVFVVYNDDEGRSRWKLRAGSHHVQFTVANDVKPGLYKLHVGAYQRFSRFQNVFALDAVNLEILGFSESGAVPSPANPGLVSGVKSTFTCNGTR
jgi:hypothetical protein